jgi:hypothetical protein
MRKTLLVLLFLPLLFFVPFTFAQEPKPSEDITEALEEETDDILFALPDSGLTPDNPFYFLDTLSENISLALTRGPEAKAKKAFSHAEEKLAEAKDMTEKGNQKATDKATKQHDKLAGKAAESLGKAKALGKDVDALAAHVAEKTLKHQAVKARVYDKLVAKGNLNAAEAVKKSMEKSINGHETALQAITKNAQIKEKIGSRGKKVKDKVKEKLNSSEESEETEEEPLEQ